MTEQEKTAYAKKVISMLANGVNPLDGSLLPDTDIVNNVHITRCLFYVSDLLNERISVNQSKSAKKLPFQINDDTARMFPFSDKPLSASEIAKSINDLVATSNMKKLTYSHITSWLLTIGMLEDYLDSSGKTKKRPTPDGNSIGITVDHRIGREGHPYTVVIYNREAQQFIIDNIQAIVASI